MKALEDELLVLHAQNGHVDAFNLLVKRHQASLIRFAYKQCQDQQMANDAVQDVWMKMAVSIKKLQEPKAFRSWLFKAVRWKVIDYQRKQQALSAKEDDLENIGDMVACQVEEHRHDGLRQYIKQMPEIERQAIHLFYLEELKVKEIAEVLDIPSGTVKSRLNRARKMLTELMQGFQES